MANGLQSLPRSSGVYFVPKSWSHSMAGCPLQSAVWKESEGEGGVRLEEVVEDHRRSPMGWAGQARITRFNSTIEEVTAEEAAVKLRLGGMRITVWWEPVTIQVEKQEKQQILDKLHMKYLDKSFSRQRGDNLFFFLYMHVREWIKEHRCLEKQTCIFHLALIPDYKRIIFYIGFKIIPRIWVGGQLQNQQCRTVNSDTHTNNYSNTELI